MILQDELQQWVEKTYDARREDRQAATIAAGFIRRRDYLYAAKQNGKVSNEGSEAQFVGRSVIIIDTREHVQTHISRGEWTGFHAEMQVFSGMMKLAFGWVVRESDIGTLKSALSAYDVAICANAPCCKHCANLLSAVGIKYKNSSGNAGKTGWWNPIADKVAENGTAPFNNNIPFS